MVMNGFNEDELGDNSQQQQQQQQEQQVEGTRDDELETNIQSSPNISPTRTIATINNGLAESHHTTQNREPKVMENSGQTIPGNEFRQNVTPPTAPTTVMNDGRPSFSLRRFSLSKRREARPFHTESVEDIVEELSINTETGLTEIEVKQRIEKYGHNELTGQDGVKWWKILLRHLVNFLNIVLAGAAILAIIVQQWIDFGVVVAIIIINVVIGFVQEFKSERTMDKLKKMTSPQSTVLREGVEQKISSRDLVPGDIVILKSGDRVPADMRLLWCNNLATDEAILTGESQPVDKNEKKVYPVEKIDIPIGDRKNMVFMNTNVIKGKGRGIVVATGMNTEIGVIASSLSKGKKEDTKLSIRMRKLGIFLVIIAAIAFAIVLLCAYLYQDIPIVPDALLIGVAVAVSVIPEALIAVITMTISIGVQRMAKQKAIVRKLSALESLGSITNICSDKTGTITAGKMVTRKVWAVETEYAVNENGDGLVDENNTPLQLESLDEGMKLCLTIFSLCNMSNVTRRTSIDESRISIDPQPQRRTSVSTTNPDETSEGRRFSISSVFQKKEKTNHIKQATTAPYESEWYTSGEPTEIALNVLSNGMGMGRDQLSSTYPLMIHEFPFDSTLKRMSVIFEKDGNEKKYVFSKGAPEKIRTMCNRIATLRDGNFIVEEMTIDYMDEIRQKNDQMAEQGLRVICLSFKEISEEEVTTDRPSIERNMIFLGSAGLYDPPRKAVSQSIETCHNAGIMVHMLTGDHSKTAFSIAKQVGIVPENISFHNAGNLIMDGSKFDRMKKEEVLHMELPLVISRCSPASKVKMVEALHQRKKYVAMTGDGVNDAPAIKIADVGIAMGKTGSDVTKEASDIVITDDNFNTIVIAVREGRTIFANIRKFIVYMLTGNTAEALSIMIPIVAGLALPLNPTQVLWINIVTATPPSLALGVEKSGSHIMNKEKRPVDEKLFKWDTIVDILFFGLFACLLILLNFFIVGLLWLNLELIRAQAFAFTTTAILLSFHTYNCRNDHASLIFDNLIWSYKIHLAVLFGIASTCFVLYVPFVNTVILRHVGIGGIEWGFVLLASLIYIIVIEIYKFFKRILRRILKNRRRKNLKKNELKKRIMESRRPKPLELEADRPRTVEIQLTNHPIPLQIVVDRTKYIQDPGEIKKNIPPLNVIRSLDTPQVLGNE